MLHLALAIAIGIVLAVLFLRNLPQIIRIAGTILRFILASFLVILLVVAFYYTVKGTVRGIRYFFSYEGLALVTGIITLMFILWGVSALSNGSLRPWRQGIRNSGTNAPVIHRRSRSFDDGSNTGRGPYTEN